jgi:hypothetical protein
MQMKKKSGNRPMNNLLEIITEHQKGIKKKQKEKKLL